MSISKSKTSITPATAKYYLLLEDYFFTMARGSSDVAARIAARIENIDKNQRYAMRMHVHSIGYGDD